MDTTPVSGADIKKKRAVEARSFFCYLLFPETRPPEVFSDVRLFSDERVLPEERLLSDERVEVLPVRCTVVVLPCSLVCLMVVFVSPFLLTRVDTEVDG